jgi:hydroxymethylbilane synthase
MQLTFATRPSALARRQTAHIIQLLQAARPGLACAEYLIPAGGHHEPDGNGFFTAELENALFLGKADAVVYSFRDLPVQAIPGLVIGAIPKRGAIQDVLVTAHGQKLSDLPPGARLGTSSLRCTAQLRLSRSDLTILLLRGNVDSLVSKVLNGEYDAIVLAQDELLHLGLESHIGEVFPLDVMLPAPGQGALAVQCRASDLETLQLLSIIHDPLTAAALAAERAFLSGLGGKYSLPVAAFAQKINGTIILTGAVISPDGKQAIRLSAVDQDPHRLGGRLADLVLERGAADLLKAVA